MTPPPDVAQWAWDEARAALAANGACACDSCTLVIARALMAAHARGAGDWQDISTAPKDGMEFQAFVARDDKPDDLFWEPRCRLNPESEAFEIWGRVDYDEDGWDTHLSVSARLWKPHPSSASIRNGGPGR